MLMSTRLTETDEITGADVVRIRKDRGLTQDELALRAGVSTGTLDRFEKSKSRTMPLQRQAIVRAAQDALEELSEARRGGSTPADAVSSIIRSRGEAPSDLFREFAAKMAKRSVNEQWVMAEAFAIALQMLSGAREGSSGEPQNE